MDIETLTSEARKFDRALCFGLLYHLRILSGHPEHHAITAKILIIESVVAPYRLPPRPLWTRRIREALNYIAFVPQKPLLSRCSIERGSRSLSGDRLARP
jgi:hypothetical protein